jgi:Glycosyl transferase family 2
MKLISFVVPCYNSQEYMRHCIDTLLPGGDQVEILIVNDGSSDNTAAIADEYEKNILTSAVQFTRKIKGMVVQ